MELMTSAKYLDRMQMTSKPPSLLMHLAFKLRNCYCCWLCCFFNGLVYQDGVLLFLEKRVKVLTEVVWKDKSVVFGMVLLLIMLRVTGLRASMGVYNCGSPLGASSQIDQSKTCEMEMQVVSHWQLLTVNLIEKKPMAKKQLALIKPAFSHTPQQLKLKSSS